MRVLVPTILLGLAACGDPEPAAAPESAPRARSQKLLASSGEFVFPDDPPPAPGAVAMATRIPTAEAEQSVGPRAILEEWRSVFEEARLALFLAAPDAASFPVRVPPRAELRFSTRIRLADVGARYLPYAARVLFVADDGTEVELRAWQDAPVPPDGGEWRSVHVDLGSLAGRSGELRFETVPRVPDDWPADARILVAAPTIACAADARPNVLFVSVDTLRRDALSCYGGDPAITPRMGELAEAGVVVEEAWTSAPWTVPAYASLFTGEQPSAHAAGRDWSEPWIRSTPPMTSVAEGAARLPTIFAEAGYATAGIYSNGHLASHRELALGFDGWLMYGHAARTGLFELERFLGEVGDQPFFCFWQLVDPHSPYVPGESVEWPAGTPHPDEVESLDTRPSELLRDGVPVDERDDYRALYRATVRYVDELVGAALDRLEDAGLADETLVVLHSDHGEELWDHGGWYHGHSHHAELVSIPLVLRFPGVLPSGTRVGGPFRGVDLLPTVLDLVGLWGEGAPDCEGRSLAAALRGERAIDPRPVLIESALLSDAGHASLVDDGWHLIVSDEEPTRLYRLAGDPRELEDLADSEPARVEAMTATLRRLEAEARARRRGPSRSVEVDEHAKEMMRLLGYFGTGEEPEEAAAGLESEDGAAHAEGATARDDPR